MYIYRYICIAARTYSITADSHPFVMCTICTHISSVLPYIHMFCVMRVMCFLTHTCTNPHIPTHTHTHAGMRIQGDWMYVTYFVTHTHKPTPTHKHTHTHTHTHTHAGMRIRGDWVWSRCAWTLPLFRCLCCNVLHCVVLCCSVLQSVAMCCNVLQCAVSELSSMVASLPLHSRAVQAIVLQYIALYYSVLQCVATYCSALQSVAECGREIQSVAQSCRVIQSVLPCQSFPPPPLPFLSLNLSSFLTDSSFFPGCWTAIKVTSQTIDSAATTHTPNPFFHITLPTIQLPPSGDS